MDPKKIRLVQETWGAVEPISEQAALMFYGQLFSLDPGLRELFPKEMAQQRVKLMGMIGVAVKGLSRPETILPVIQESGRRHVGYKVEESQYDTVGQALLWTLQQGLGEAFTPEVADAWAEVYGFLAETMKAAAREAAPAVARS